MTTADRELLTQELMQDEGFRLRVYKDSLGIETIGIGRNLRDKGISSSEALTLFNNDVEECLTDLSTFPWFGSLDSARQIALCNLRFNLGPAKLRTFVHFLGCMAAGDYAGAANHLLDSKWATQVQRTRRDRIVAHIRDGR